MNVVTGYIMVLVFLLIFISGLTFWIVVLVRKIQSMRKPIYTPILNEEYKQLMDSVQDLNLEERMMLIHGVMGSCRVLCSVSHDGIIITYAGESPVEDSREVRDYTG